MTRITFHLAVLSLAMLVVASTTKAEENASNPLAAVNNTDIRYQYFDLEGGGQTVRTCSSMVHTCCAPI